MVDATDLDGLFKIQKAMLEDLKNNNAGSALDIKTYAEQLDMYNAAFQSANQNSNVVLKDQQDVQAILDSELNRLKQKKTNVDEAIEGRYRGTLLNENYRLRYMEYTKILIIFVVSLISVIILINFRSYLPFIPDFIIDFVIIIISSVSIITCFYIYMGILSRDKIYFNELALSPPTTVTPSNIIGTGKQRNQTLYQYLGGAINMNTCIGSDCCDDINTFYNTTSGKCSTTNPSITPNPTTVPTTRSGFTTLDLAYKNSELNKIGNQSGVITSNTPTEFNEYAVYN